MDADAAHEFEKVAKAGERHGEFMHNMIGREQLSMLRWGRAKMQSVVQ